MCTENDNSYIDSVWASCSRHSPGGRHIMLVAVMVASAVGATERVGDGHIMLVVVMVAPTVCGAGGCKPGMERVGSTPLTRVIGLFSRRIQSGFPISWDFYYLTHNNSNRWNDHEGGSFNQQHRQMVNGALYTVLPFNYYYYYYGLFH